MRGVIVKWDDEKGYGFIRIDGGNKEIFCHISDFSPRNPRPEIDEAVGFEVVSDGKGRFSAKQICYLNRERAVSPGYRKKHRKDEESPTSIVRVVLSLSVGLLLVSVIGYEAYQYASEKLTPKQENTPVKTQVLPEIKRRQPDSSPYRCDGRQHCSQMTSCEEAKWFVRNCSDTKMDGDGDGIPCEDKCGGW
ncbi:MULTISPECIES: excalibur calcium-binding domain-containing protein [Neisseria]|uniref:excalibur calcium-binding domain-containing protein n=1 Tax=Neisseria TaxID=482 RepID=UPI000E59DF46|nr:excalibur calcium-binding domain-containing protein [Neisseria sp. Marseille-Q1983]